MDLHFEPAVVRLSTADASASRPRDHIVDFEIGGVRLQIRDLASLATLAALGLTAGVLVQELRKSPELRTWHDKLWGVVPYDLRPPTLERAWRTVWRPEVERLFTDKAFGIGWDINLAALRRHRGPNGGARGQELEESDHDTA